MEVLPIDMRNGIDFFEKRYYLIYLNSPAIAKNIYRDGNSYLLHKGNYEDIYLLYNAFNPFHVKMFLDLIAENAY